MTASADGTARIYNTMTGACQAILIGHEGEISKVRCAVVLKPHNRSCTHWLGVPWVAGNVQPQRVAHLDGVQRQDGARVGRGVRRVLADAGGPHG